MEVNQRRRSWVGLLDFWSRSWKLYALREKWLSVEAGDQDANSREEKAGGQALSIVAGSAGSGCTGR